MAQQLPNYFTFTLGEEHTINASYRHNWETVNDFLDEKARVTPDDPAVGFPVPKSNSNEQWSSEVFCKLHLTQTLFVHSIWLEKVSELSEALLIPGNNISFLTKKVSLSKL